MMHALTVENLSKRFGPRQVLDKVSLKIKPQEIFALLGLNGAGKTTLIRSLLGFLRPQAGRVLLGGEIASPYKIREKVSYLPENFSPPYYLKAIEFLSSLASLWPRRKFSPQQLLALVGLEGEGNKYLRFYSRGMIQRFGLALCLLKDPQIIILDEPLLGLDVLGQRKMYELMKSLQKEGKTIIFSSHIFSQIEAVADALGIISKGHIVFLGTATELKAKSNCPSLEKAFLKTVQEADES